MPLSKNAQIKFNRFCEARIVSVGQLWVGKINVALDRQHPRDMFDVRNLLNNTGLTDEIKTGFLFFYFAESVRFTNCSIRKGLIKRQFSTSGLAECPTNLSLIPIMKKQEKKIISLINNSLSETDKSLLVSFAKGESKWDTSDYGKFPAIRWKLLNINILKNYNPPKHFEQIELLEKALQ